jgi:tRNA (guanine-N7-)-methyltransferase
MKSSPYAHAPRLPEGTTLDPRLLFEERAGPRRVVELEIGPGRGGFMLERVAAIEGVCLLGLEIRRKWATLVDERLAALGYAARARVFAEDAKLVLPRFTQASFARVFVHFPDPWWKKRHHKRLLLSPAVAAELWRVLEPGGELLIQTDVPERAEAYGAILAQAGGFEVRLGPADPADNRYLARSPRERRAIADGLPVWRLQAVRATA